MKLLLVGPYPPPHGGVSVHIAETKRRANSLGIPCRVLNTDRNAEWSPNYIRVRRPGGFVLSLVRHSLRGWTIHVHTNGHNLKSWLVALAGGLAGRVGAGGALTLHSGKMPDYVGAKRARRWLARLTCRTFKEITCVSSRLRESVESLGVPSPRIKVSPAFGGVTELSNQWVLSPNFEKWFARHNPVFSATASNRPEYGIELLIEAISRLLKAHKDAGCLLIGVGEEAKSIRSLIEQRNLSRSVLMLGDVPHEECLHVISRSVALVRPTFADGDSISVREALALGVPVIASDAAERPEGTVLFETGNLDDLMKKIECVLEGSFQNSAR
jgi:glycosyltransferase involved in cell wall biosynthesis